ncbi:tetratricopeptide repeat (TPR)-like superfamily protein [Actinidia rufa]|uniref:Tetratricopeptide repeat (TPR)-like superfamily protein n=1 Tax=Actinidia rufa TaxID=165716 RepID=A0A7J0GCI1_9ERIC|nr:tetratricopeptide repeat (TPR)-like superfamily protein [Actinidia rufa]
MFSISAINDTDSKGQWEPLAPTKEAQEFHLSQTYHEGLLKLEAKEFEKARELLESVLKDPLISGAQVDSNGSDGHLLQLRFLALKNLASVFLQQGAAHYESALCCYLQAVEIDTKDSVVWNQLGTLSCSMGLLSISRWAFEQGLFCSPNNWNCMEKLLEVLIAIGDEVACLSVAQLILRHWPSHSRALHVKSTIEESEPIQFSPRGIDKLEPKHARLKFLDKRKITDENLDEGVASKKLNQNIELQLAEVSWIALADALLGILLPLSGCDSEQGSDELYKSGDIRISLQLPQGSENTLGSADRKWPTINSVGESMSVNCCNSKKAIVFGEKETNVYEEQPQERRSSRLERLRSRKPGKEELDFANGKDLAKVVIQFLEPFVVCGEGAQDGNNAVSCSVPCLDVLANLGNTEFDDVTRFVRETSKNYGAYHMGHLLLEEVASRAISYRDTFTKFLELEKLTRQWGRDRTPECNLFLAELYYDLGSRSSDTSKSSEFVCEASFHLCKIIESVALDYPLHINGLSGDDAGSSKYNSETSVGTTSLLASKFPFWVRFFWLSGRLSMLDGNKAKSQQEFGISLSLLRNEENTNNPLGSVCLPHCKDIQNLTVDRILHEISLLEVDFLLKKATGEMIEKEMYVECVDLLAPLIFSTKDIQLDISYVSDNKGEEVASVELSALDVLIKACEKAKLTDSEVLLNCHRKKLQILLVAAGMDEYLASHKSIRKMSGLKPPFVSGIESNESPGKHWNQLVAEEVKAISQCASQMKNFIDPSGNSNGFTVVLRIVGDIQSLLLALMCNIANIYFSKKSAGPAISDQVEQSQRSCFIDAAITFWKLQLLNPNVPIKNSSELYLPLIELIVAMHDMLSEFGLCCASGDGEVEEGTFLKRAIKHLLSLDMKLKSNFHSLNKGVEKMQCDEQLSHNNHVKIFQDKSKSDTVNIVSDTVNVSMDQPDRDRGNIVEKDALEGGPSMLFHDSVEKESTGLECSNCTDDGPNDALHKGENASSQLNEFGRELTEDEREELELGIDNALDQCFFCLYGLNLRSDSSYEDDLVLHKNTSRGNYQTKEQCADVFQYILPYAKASSRNGLVKLRRVLRAIRKHFPQPPDDVLAGYAIDKFLDDPNLCEDKLSEEAGSDGFLDSIMKIIFPEGESHKQLKASSLGSSEPYSEVYRNLYYLLAQSEEMSATDKWAGFVLTKEGEEFVEQNTKLFKYDLLYNPSRFESWQRLGNIYDEEVDLLLNDGSKQINVSGWRKNATLPHRVETSRRRSRRCLLMTLALAKTPVQQGEIHELLALVYYDGLQNVVPFYDQRSVVPTKDAAWMMFCRNSMRHFNKAFAHKEDWSHAFYLGKLSEKLGYSHEISFSYYAKAIDLNTSAVDAIYRMHASRLKLLCTCGKQSKEALKVVAEYSFSQPTKENVMNILTGAGPEIPELPMDVEDKSIQTDPEDAKQVDSHQLEDVWHMLYKDCLSALEICVEGDLKHFHKARYMLAQGLYRRGASGDLERAKDELSFCFKSSRSSFTINMWEIDSMVKKGRRKTPGLSGNRKVLEVHLPESSRKFITCIRKYILFYWKLLEETGDICTLDRAYISLRADKRFSLCLEDLVPVALGRYVRALISSMHQTENVASGAASTSEHLLEKMFLLFVEQMNLWSDICYIPEISSPEFSESNLYGYLHQYIQLLESNGKAEVLEGTSEKIRKRFKNPKLSNGNCAKVYKHISIAWYRSLVISLTLITPLHSGLSSEIQVPNQSDTGPENGQLLCVDLPINELWNSSFEDPNHLKNLKTKWSPLLSKVKNVILKKASVQDLETANTLLRCSYNFCRDSSCAMLPSSVNLYVVPFHLAAAGHFYPGIDDVSILDLSIPRKLLLWAYTLLHGRYTNITIVLKYCEENAKSKMKKGTGCSSVPSNTNTPAAATSHTGGEKDVACKHNEAEVAAPSTTVASAALPKNVVCKHNEAEVAAPSTTVASAALPKNVVCKHSEAEVAAQSTTMASAALPKNESAHSTVLASLPESSESAHNASSPLPEGESTFGPNLSLSGENQKILSANPYLLRCNNNVVERMDLNVPDGADPESSL